MTGVLAERIRTGVSVGAGFVRVGQVYDQLQESFPGVGFNPGLDVSWAVKNRPNRLDDDLLRKVHRVLIRMTDDRVEEPVDLQVSIQVGGMIQAEILGTQALATPVRTHAFLGHPMVWSILKL